MNKNFLTLQHIIAELNKYSRFITASIIIGLFFLVVLSPNLPKYGDFKFDADAYIRMAENVAYHGYFGLGAPSAWFMPGYPIFISVFIKIFSKEFLTPLRTVQFGLALANLFFLCRITKKIFGKRISKIAYCVGLIYLPFYWQSGQVLTEGIYLFAFMLFLWLVQACIESKNVWLSILAGVVFAGQLYVRPTMAMAMGVYWGINVVLRRTKVIKALTIIGITSLLLLIPWWWRNFEIFKTFVPFSNQSGEVLLGGSYVDYKYDSSTWPNGKNELETDQLRYMLGVERTLELAKNPMRLASWYFKKIYYYQWLYPYYENSYYLLPFELVEVLHWSVLIFGFLGILISIKRRLGGGFIIYLLIYSSAMHAIWFSLNRYALPYMYIWIIFAGVSLDILIRKKWFYVLLLLLFVTMSGMLLSKKLISILNQRIEYLPIHQTIATKILDVPVLGDKFTKVIRIKFMTSSSEDLYVSINKRHWKLRVLDGFGNKMLSIDLPAPESSKADISFNKQEMSLAWKSRPNSGVSINNGAIIEGTYDIGVVYKLPFNLEYVWLGNDNYLKRRNLYDVWKDGH